jgi:hypothetical protein
MDVNKEDPEETPQNGQKLQHPHKMTLAEFIKLFRIGDIPVIYFIIIYIVLYILNGIFCTFDYKMILVATIPVTIIINILANPKMEISGIIVGITALSLLYLVWCG